MSETPATLRNLISMTTTKYMHLHCEMSTLRAGQKRGMDKDCEQTGL